MSCNSGVILAIQVTRETMSVSWDHGIDVRQLPDNVSGNFWNDDTFWHTSYMDYM